MEKDKKVSQRSIVGIVVSDKMDKTVVVAISIKKKHPIYGKFITSTKKYKTQNKKNECKIGDTVRIVETRPLSKDKYFRVQEIVERAK